MDKDGHEAAKEIIKSAEEKDKGVTTAITEHLNKCSEEDRQKHIIALAAPEHTYGLHHTTVHPDGTAHSVDLNKDLAKRWAGKKTVARVSGKKINIHVVEKEENGDPKLSPVEMNISPSDRRGYHPKKTLSTNISARTLNSMPNRI